MFLLSEDPNAVQRPFAYRFQRFEYDDMTDDVLYPRCRPVYQHIVKQYPDPNKVAHDDIEAFWDGDAKVSISLVSDKLGLVTKPALDMDAIRREAQQMIDEDAKEQAEWLKTIKGTVTGSPWLCDMGIDYVVSQLVEARQFVWRKPEEIDWAAVEAVFVEARREMRETLSR